MNGHPLMVVRVDISRDVEAEWNEWYNTVHLPEILRVPGFISGRRYRAAEGGPKYMALYQLESVDAFTSEAVDLLRGWDYTQPKDSAAAAYFNVVWATILRLTFDELPEDFRPDGGDRWFQVVRTLMPNAKDAWWDDLTPRSTKRVTAAAQRSPTRGSTGRPRAG